MFYQLKAIRKNTKPPIWRRILVPSNITFAQLAVILEEALEYSKTDQYEIDFYRKLTLYEWQDDDIPFSSYNNTFRNATDTFINHWMENEKSFSFRLREDDSLAYKCEIEKVLDRKSVV